MELLKCAGQAAKALTNGNSTAGAAECPDFGHQRSEFSAAARAYFDKLSSIDVNVRRQILDLKNMDIIAGEDHLKTGFIELDEPSQEEPLDAASMKHKSTRKNAITAGGLGDLDIGWLNSRNDNVGKETEASLWQEARQHVQNHEHQRSSQCANVSSSPGAESQGRTEAMDQS